MLTDDFAGEQCAIRKAFRGLEEGEMGVTHLLCSVHSDRALQENLAGPACKTAAKHLRAALYNRKTRAGCEESVAAVLGAAPKDKKRYIEKEWLATMADWGHYARCHSAFLLQVPSTNVVESWHASIKHSVKSEMRSWSLSGLVQHVADKAHQWSSRAEKELQEWSTKHLTDTWAWPAMRKLPLPVQKLVMGELKEADKLIDAGEPPRELGDHEPTCNCVWFRSYCLPRRHLWQMERLWGGVLTPERWAIDGQW